MTAETPLLAVEGLTKVYRQGLFDRRETFRLRADFTVAAPQIVGVMGLGQDDAVRADHRLEPPQRRPGAVRRP